MKIIFDLDYTLLDTVKFKEALKEAVTSCGVDPDRYEDTYKSIVKRDGKAYDYDPDVHLEALASDLGSAETAAEARHRIDEVLASTEKYLYPGSVELLADLRREGNTLVLLTLGNEDWQRAKVEHSGLTAMFDGVIATGKKKSGIMKDLAAKGEKVVVVNDNGEEMKEMMAEMPEFTYVLKKGPKPVPRDLGLAEVGSIEELEEYFVRGGALKEASREAGAERTTEAVNDDHERDREDGEANGGRGVPRVPPPARR